MNKILSLSLLLLPLQLAQAADGRDYGYLSILPGGQQLFNISSTKVSSPDLKAFDKLKINPTAQGDEYTWQVPKSGEKQSLVVEWSEARSKLARVTRTGRIPGKAPIEEVAITSRLKTHGVLASYTICSEEFKTTFGLKTQSYGNVCSTWNKDTCAYVKKIIDDGELSEKIKECNGLLKSLNQHQERLANLANSDYQEDLKALKRVTSKKNQKNSFELSADSIGNISQIYSSYEAGAELCNKLMTGGDARFEDSDTSSTSDGDDKKAVQQ